MSNGTELILAILDVTTKDFLGCVGLHSQSTPKVAELGIWVKKSAHGRKIGREAVRAVFEWSVHNLDIETYRYPVAKENISSRKIAESLGGVVEQEKSVTYLSGAVVTECIYKITPVKLTT